MMCDNRVIFLFSFVFTLSFSMDQELSGCGGFYKKYNISHLHSLAASHDKSSLAISNTKEISICDANGDSTLVLKAQNDRVVFAPNDNNLIGAVKSDVFNDVVSLYDVRSGEQCKKIEFVKFPWEVPIVFSKDGSCFFQEFSGGILCAHEYGYDGMELVTRKGFSDWAKYEKKFGSRFFLTMFGEHSFATNAYFVSQIGVDSMLCNYAGLITSLAISDDNLLVASHNKSITLWNIAGLRKICVKRNWFGLINFSGDPVGLAFYAKYLIVALKSGILHYLAIDR